MPQMTTVNIPANTWTQITNANATSITFQNVSAGYEILIEGTVGAVAPSSQDGALVYQPGQGERNVVLTDLFPGITGVNRVYAWCANFARVSVNHA